MPRGSNFARPSRYASAVKRVFGWNAGGDARVFAAGADQRRGEHYGQVAAQMVRPQVFYPN
jgi:hypothetical protein